MAAQTSGSAIKIDGLRQLERNLNQLSPAIKKEFRTELRKVADVVIEDVKRQMPEKTGKAKSSVRAVYSYGALAIKAGGAKAPYYPWLDFGGAGVVGYKGSTHGRYRKKDKRPFIKEGRWIYPTIVRVRPEVVRRARAAIEKAKRSARL